MRSWITHLSIAFLVASPSVGLGQLAESTPPPPAHLPRLIDECEAGPGYFACSVWIWHGSSYSAIWQNGAVGRLTVANSGGSDLRIERKDSAGPVAGLTASYNGNWDGKSFSAGKMTATLKSATRSLTWTANPAVTPIFASSQQDYTYVNWYTAPLTAYAIYNSRGSFNTSVGTEINDYRIRGEPPMSPGEARRFTNRFEVMRANYAKGVTYPQAATIAASYADGTTFGDAGVLQAMLDRRKWMLVELTRIGTTLCGMDRQGASLREISSALDAQAGGAARSSAYSIVQKDIAHRMRQAANQAVRRIWGHVNRLRSGLAADPVKDGRGDPVVPPVSPLACDLR
jgi:hypothetical protein